MFGNKKLSDLDDWELIAANDQCKQVLKQREEASKHDKFKKMAFPPPNPEFIKIVNDIDDEMKKRKLT